MVLLGVCDGGGVEICGYSADSPSKRDAREHPISPDDSLSDVDGLEGVQR